MIAKPTGKRCEKGAPLPATQVQRRNYHLRMAEMCSERGFQNLAESHVLAAYDPPDEEF